MSYGTRQQWSTTTKASLKTADELTSMDSKKLAALPSSKNATTTATSKNAPSTSAISSSVVSRTRKDYTSSAPPWEGPFTVAKLTGSGSYRLQTLEGEDVNNSWNVDQLCRFYA
jgi:hypothetical protein